MEQFDAQEISAAQAALDFHPDASPFWDSRNGQQALYIARRVGLKASNTNRERCALYAAQKEQDEYGLTMTAADGPDEWEAA